MPHGDDRTWIQTYTGRAFWPLDPRPEDVCIEDIAHALALKCRYTGHCREFYSIAQHSVLASYHCPDRRWALMHDAAEAYIADVARPVKHALVGFGPIECRLEEVIAEAFGLSMPIPETVKLVDLRLLATERRDLMGPPPLPWTSIENIGPLSAIIDGWDWEYAEEAFLSRFKELFRD